MSLIQDALKRKTEEKHPLPDILPTPSPSQPPIEPPAKPPVEPPVQPAPTKWSIEPMNSSMKKFFIILVAAVVVILILIGTSIYMYLNAPKTPVEEENTGKPAASVVMVQPAAVPAPAMVATPKAKPDDNWPDLNFSGSAAGGSQILAVINGRMLSVGNRINGAKVLQIGKNEVLVEFEGEKRILRVDGIDE